MANEQINGYATILGIIAKGRKIYIYKEEEKNG